jgi:alpha,alpha-trehalase
MAERSAEKSFLPSILHALKLMQKEPISNYIVVFLDYNAIVSQPENARMSDEIRKVVKELASFCRVAIISGRNRVDVEKLVGLTELIYVGSHGLDISGPGNICMEHEEGKQYLLDLDKAQQELQQRIGGIEGARIERKKYAIAIHYSNVAEDNVLTLLEIVYRMANDSERLELGLGKKIIELHPAFDWHKEKTIAWLMKALKIDLSLALPIYIGEDITDQDAFRFLENSGRGVLITCHRKHTQTPYQLEDNSQVQQLLYSLIHFFKS